MARSYISFAMLRRGVYLAGRTLLTPHPTFANGAMAAIHAIRNERDTHGKPFLDTWFEINDRNGRHYQIERSDGRGEYLRHFPAGIPKSAVISIEVPDSHPASDLLDQLEALIKQLQTSTRFYDEPTNSTLELQGGAAAQLQLQSLLPLIGSIRSATVPAYDDQMICHLIGQLGGAARNYVDTGDFVRFQNRVSVTCSTGEMLRTSFLSDCYLASVLMVLRELGAAIFKDRIASGTSESQAREEYLRRVTELRTASKQDALHLLGFATARALRDGACDVVTQLADQQLASGLELIRESLDAATRHRHGDALYRAAPFLFVSNQLFRNVLSSAPLLPNVNMQWLKQQASVSEENLVKVADALLYALRDRGDELLNAHRRECQQLAARNEAAAVDGVIRDLIDLRFYYPRVFGEFLRGGPMPLG